MALLFYLSRPFLELRTLNFYKQRAMSTSKPHEHLADDCIFCKIIRKEIPSFKLVETEKSYAFMDIEPLSEGHSLVIPKYHAEFMHQVPDDYLAEVMPIAKRIAAAGGFAQYNVLQNNGPLANQAVPHVHFHVIPKPNKELGLGVRWAAQKKSMDDIKAVYDRIVEKLNLRFHQTRVNLLALHHLRQRRLLNANNANQGNGVLQKRQLSIWTLPKILLHTTGKKNRGVILSTLGAATLLSSFLGPVVWITVGGAASLVSWRLYRKAKSWWNYLAPSKVEANSSGQAEPSLVQALLSQIGTHRAEEMVRMEAIKSLKSYFEKSKRGKEVLQEFGLDHPNDLVWEDVHRSETVRLDGGKKHRVSVNFWLEDQTSRGPKGGGCEVTASALVSGQGNINLEQIKLSSPDWHEDELISLS
ncbi:hypothetical protein [Parasitella parasitica]|uniref:HIT domain-containing protein n=1 Tax=Parasitella parasitica TaxID=35722 RepID=A0A0B7NC10_9FUNG|nr:hypothetical protein [Parasitella parasitica]